MGPGHQVGSRSLLLRAPPSVQQYCSKFSITREGACWKHRISGTVPDQPNLTCISLSYSYAHARLRSTGLEEFSQHGKSARIVPVSRAHQEKCPFSHENCPFLNSEKSKVFPVQRTQTAPESAGCQPTSSSRDALCRCFVPRKPVYSLTFCSVPLLPGELDNVLKSCKYLSLSFLCIQPSSCTKQKATQAQYQELKEFVQVCYVRVQNPAASLTHLTSGKELGGEHWFFPLPPTAGTLLN